MNQISSLFREHGIPLYLVGTAARHRWQQAPPLYQGVVEWIALSPKHKVLQLPGLPLRNNYHRGPLLVDTTSQDNPAHGYITCVDPGKAPEAALERALRRRRFAIDALALQEADDQIGACIDPFQARAALPAQQHLLKGEEEAFANDALSMLRYGCLVAELGEDEEVHQTYLASAQEHATRILYAPRYGWFQLLTQLLCGPHADLGLQWLYESRLLGLLLPEVHSSVDFAKSSPYHHKDLWKHTKQVVIQAHPSPLVRWAALLHDIGKCWTRTYTEQGGVNFYQHEELGAVLVEGIAARLGMPTSFRDDLIFLVRHHQRPNAYASEWKDAALRRLIKHAGKLLKPMMRLSKADFTSKIPQKRAEAARLAAEFEARVEGLQEEAAKQPLLPSGIGKAIIDAFALTPGPHIGKIKQHLEQQIEEDVLPAREAAEFYVGYLRENPDIIGVAS